MRASVILVAVALALVVAAPAFAEHTMEHVQQTTQELIDRYLPPGYGSDTGIINAFDPLNGYTRPIGLHGTAMFCQQYGGYWYDGGDGNLYWHDCAGA